MGEPLCIAFYCTGHGLGHATRVVEICKHLVELGHTVTVVTAAPARFFASEIPPTRFQLRKATLDCGSKQLDAFTVDMRGSLEEYHALCVEHRDELLAQEVAWLKANRIDLVATDVVPIVCTAAAQVGIPAVCVSNFTWDFIYSEYLTSARKAQYREMVWQIARDYANAALCLRLPGYVPMPACAHIEDVPLVVRRARTPPAQVRAALGIPESARVAVLLHGGHKAEVPVKESYLPPGWVCVACTGGRPLSDQPLPPNFIMAPPEVYTPDLVNASDCVLGKIGYGLASECLAHLKPLLYVRRDFFNEEPFLRKVLEVHGAAVEMKRRDFLEGHWAPYLQRATALRVTYDAPLNGAEVVAARLEQVGRREGPLVTDPAARLRTAWHDAIVFGYLMQTPHSGRVEVPDWYVNGAEPRGSAAARGIPRIASMEALSPALNALLGDWVVVAGRGGAASALAQLPDTLDFLALLAGLDEDHHQQQQQQQQQQQGGAPGRADPGQPTCDDDAEASAAAAAALTAELPERRAARGLFRWDDDIVMARAPGRLDVMGGIADYSGSLVLQMPIAEACHVALQTHPLPLQKVWRHMEARHNKAPGGARPALRVVSLHADATNRAPTFDMDLDDLFEPVAPEPTTSAAEVVVGSGTAAAGPRFACARADAVPVSYEAARAYFRRDPAGSWAAYVAGCLLVLAREKGVRYTRGMSMLVASDVPEGKGVSSSAALEVAVMSALAAAHSVHLPGRELALLCQKVENLVVGAPCGVMDQMASALGHAGTLLALLCQPAEVLGHVRIPPQLRFWGIDSGIRHSVGGADYGSVRVGTFMGLACMARDAAFAAPAAPTPMPASASSPADGSGSAATAPPAEVSGGGGSGGAARAAAPVARGPFAGGHLANVAPSAFREHFESSLPESLTGSEFFASVGPHFDQVTTVAADMRYAVRVPAGHPVGENFRVNVFRAMLQALHAHDGGGMFDRSGFGGSGNGAATDTGSSEAVGDSSGASSATAEHAPTAQSVPNSATLPPAVLSQAEVLGELMFQSHASYSACGLGSDGTDRLVGAVRDHLASARAAGRPPALFGAKITGGGCGGTVCMLGAAAPEGQAAVDALAAQYARDTGHAPYVFSGSSMGAADFQTLRLRRKPHPVAEQ